MYSEYWFSDLAGSLREGFFADDVILTLAKLERDGKTGPSGQTVLKKAADWLDKALKGHAWLNEPTFSEQSGTCASFFGQAVRALPVVSTSEAFVRDLDDLKRTALEIADGGSPRPEELDALRRFFFNASQMYLERTEQLLEHEAETDVFGFFGVPDTD